MSSKEVLTGNRLTAKTVRRYASLLRGMGDGMKGLLPEQARACRVGAKAIDAVMAIKCIDCNRPELLHSAKCPWRKT